MVDMKSAWCPYPGMDGFEVNVAHLAREKLMKIRKSCLETSFDRKTRSPVEKLNEEKFVREFTRASLLGWKGFKLSFVDQLLPVDVKKEDFDLELEYTPENAETLVSNSSDFDTWLNETVFDLENFRST
jgi:hypothetical protein